MERGNLNLILTSTLILIMLIGPGIAQEVIPDTDQDGISDADETNLYQTDSNNVDSDGDGLNDNDEIKIGTNPNDLDTDEDGRFDGSDSYPLVPISEELATTNNIINIANKFAPEAPYPTTEFEEEQPERTIEAKLDETKLEFTISD